MIAIGLLVSAFFALLGWLGAAAAQDQPIKEEVAHGVILCAEEGEPIIAAWDRNELLAVGRALAPSITGKAVGIRRESCVLRMPDAACFGAPRVLLCRSAALVRILKASAWMTARMVLEGGPRYEEFRRLRPRAVRDAFLYADGGLIDGDADDLVETIRRAERQTEKSSEHSVWQNQSEALVAIYQRIVDFNMAALIGHETSHMFRDICPIEELSRMEETGLFARIQTLQMSGELFCKRFPVLEEIKADRCALRHIRRLDERPLDDIAQAESMERFVRRISADMIAFQALVGWRRYPGLPKGTFVLRPLNQYFYSSLRLLLMAAEANGGAGRAALCGEASSLFAHGVQEDYKACAEGGIVPGEILGLLPPGVETSWNGAPWTEESHACTHLD